MGRKKKGPNRARLVASLQETRQDVCGDGACSDPADAAALSTIVANAAAIQAVLENKARSAKVVLCTTCGKKPVEPARLSAGLRTCAVCAKAQMEQPVPSERIAAMRRQIRASDAKKAARKPKRSESEGPGPGAW